MFSTKNLLTALAVATTLSVVSCKDAAKEKEKATADSLAKVAKEVAVADSLKKIADAAEAAKPKTLVDLASAATPTLAKAVVAAGLAETLSTGSYTVFAPSDAAFTALGAALEDLMKPEKKDALAAILKNHVTAGAVKAADLKDGQMVKMLGGKEVKVSIKDGKVMIGNANVTGADNAASNGVVHLIDAVIK